MTCKNPSKINFSIPNASKFAAQNFPVGGATGVLYARRSADGISTRGSAESVLVLCLSEKGDRKSIVKRLAPSPQQEATIQNGTSSAYQSSLGVSSAMSVKDCSLCRK